MVVEVGAGLRSYTAGDRAILDGYGEDEMAPAGRGQVLIPWPNRLQDGAYEFAGTQYRLPLNEPEAGNAIHGLVRWAAWSVGERDRGSSRDGAHAASAARLSVRARAHARVRARPTPASRVTSTATNVGREACPYGSGMHPYLTVGTETVDTVVLRAPGRTVLQTDARGIPVGAAPVEGTEYDFRQPRAIGSTRLDNAYTDLERDDDGRARVELRHPDDGSTLSVWLGEGYRYLELFTGDSQPSVDRRSLAVEPMTCPPNAFRSGEGVLVLEPGRVDDGRMGDPGMSDDDLAVARQFLEALAAAARTGDHDGLYPLLAPDVEWLTPLRNLHGVGEVRDQPSWPWIAPRTSLEIDFEEKETTDLGGGRIVSDFREVYRTKSTGDFAYARDRRIELTIRGDKVARYELRFDGS